MLPSFEGTVIQ